MGARAVLSPPTSQAILTDPKIKLDEDMRVFAMSSAHMEPKTAASDWLALANRKLSLQDSQSSPFGMDNFPLCLRCCLPKSLAVS